MKHIAVMSPMLGEESRLVLPQVLDRIRADAPNVIVYEPVCVWTRIVVQMLQVPAISLRPAYAMNEHFNSSFSRKPSNPAGETFDERHLFVGPPILPRHQATDFPLGHLSTAQPVLYISLGTIFNNEPAFLRLCFEAFRESDYQVVLSRGKHIDPAALGSIPDNFLVSPYVPQLEILSRVYL